MFSDFSISEGFPVQITTLANGTKIHDTRSLIEPIPKTVMRETSWKDFLSGQAEWIQELLHTIEYKDGFPNPLEILDAHDSPKEPKLLIVSDGSVKFHQMSFGWVIAHEDGTVLVQGADPSHG